MILTKGIKYIFDTSVFIGALHNYSPARNLMTQAQSHDIPVGYCIVTETELWAGIRGVWTVEQHKRLLRPFDRYFINVTIARRAGELKSKLAQSGIPFNQRPYLMDCLIAATAEYHHATVCTADKNDFAKFSQFSISVLTYQ